MVKAFVGSRLGMRRYTEDSAAGSYAYRRLRLHAELATRGYTQAQAATKLAPCFGYDAPTCYTTWSALRTVATLHRVEVRS